MTALEKQAEKDALENRTIEREIELLKLDIYVDDLRQKGLEVQAKATAEQKNYLTI